MLDLFLQPFVEFEFMRRALLGCLAISVSAAPVGVFLMLRRMGLTGDVMAHGILPGAAVGFLVAGLSTEAMTLGAIIAGCLVALLSGIVSRSTNVAEDSSMAAFYLISLALGTLMSVGVMILPAAMMRYWLRNLDALLLGSMISAIIACEMCLLASYYVAWPSGPAIILSLGFGYVLSFVFGLNGGLVSELSRQKNHLSA